jgi:hypothetical protein
MSRTTERLSERVMERLAKNEPMVLPKGNNSPTNAETAQMIERLWAEMPTKQRVIAKRGDTVIYGDYIELPQILRRLQEVFGMNYSIWFATPIFHENTVIIRAVVVAGDTQAEGFGTATIRNGDVETAVKSAETDAVKRACRYFGIGAFLYEKGLTETNGSNSNRTDSTPAKPSRSAQPATAEKGELPNLPPDLKEAVVHAFRCGLNEDEITFEEGYNFLRKYASAKQANALVRYPDLVEEFCDRLFVLQDDSDIRQMVSELVNTAITRFRNNEAWQDYYNHNTDPFED